MIPFVVLVSVYLTAGCPSVTKKVMDLDLIDVVVFVLESIFAYLKGPSGNFACWAK